MCSHYAQTYNQAAPLDPIFFPLMLRRDLGFDFAIFINRMTLFGLYAKEPTLTQNFPITVDQLLWRECNLPSIDEPNINETTFQPEFGVSPAAA